MCEWEQLGCVWWYVLAADLDTLVLLYGSCSVGVRVSVCFFTICCGVRMVVGVEWAVRNVDTTVNRCIRYLLRLWLAIQAVTEGAKYIILIIMKNALKNISQPHTHSPCLLPSRPSTKVNKLKKIFRELHNIANKQ